MRISRHRLVQDDGTPIPYRRSPNQSPGLEPKLVVVHYTAGASAESSIDWLTNPASRAGTHVVVGRDGSVTQLVSFDRQAWHAGRSEWQGLEGLNAHSFGIELDNGGPLQQHRDGSWHTPFGATVPQDQVLEATHRHGGATRGWHTYTGEQLIAASEVANLLVGHYGLGEVVGHDDIAPGRKTDPGPAFPMQTFRARVIGRADDAAGVVGLLAQTTSALNIRLGPGTNWEKLAVSPLPAGTKVEILAEEGSWRQVFVLDFVGGEMDIEGWVHGRYLESL